MGGLLRFTPLVFATALVMAAFAAGSPWSNASAARGGVIPDTYIVTFKPGVEPRSKANDKARAYGLQLRHVYESTINGFAAFVPPGQLKRLQNDPDVATVVEDRRVVAFNDQRPTGLRRIQADRNATAQIGSHTNPIDVDVAVIDSGIDPGHPDLNVVGGISCVPGDPSYADQNGHGTHVAGTIGALDNGSGVVGVAPGARLWAVRVLDANGEGQFSDVICGIDWVTANAGTIEVANMSLGGEAPIDSCTDGSLHAAICRSIDTGVTYVVASGNSGLDASGFVPAAYPEVITVSAIVDTDGSPGGRGTTSFLYGDDDELATFSNYGAPVDIAAPGVDVYSTWPGGYTYSSGTSMASPHVAGAAAIYLFLNPASAPSSVRSYLLSIAWAQGSEQGFTNDVDEFPEPLLNGGEVGGPALPPPTPSCTLNSTEGIVGSSVRVSCANLGSNESVRVYWDSTATIQRSSFFTSEDGSGTGSMTVPDATGGEHAVIVRGTSSAIEISIPFTVRPGIKLSSVSGKVGSFTLATLTGFAAGETIALTWDAGTSSLASATASATGRASVSLTIPEAVSGGHVIAATGTASRAEAAYSVLPGASLSTTMGAVGTRTTVIFRGYGAGEEITISWQDTPTSKVTMATVTTSGLGSATAPITVPEAVKGSHLIEGVGSSGGRASASFTVTPAMALSATSGNVGSGITVTVTGFAASESITLNWYETQTSSTTLGSVVTSAQGGTSVRIAIPETVGGTHRFDAVGVTSGTRTAYVTVKAAIGLAPASGEAGASVVATLTGYRPGETISVKWFSSAFASTTVATATASDKGSATANFTVPNGAAAGDHKVEALGGASYALASTTFAVASSGGPTPSPDPTCSLDRTSGPVGTSLGITCSNFAVNESVRIYWDDTATQQRAWIWTGTSGGGTTSFFVPDSAAGPHRVIALGATSGLRIELTFSIVPSIVLSTTSGKVGTFMYATLKGFAANENVTLTWDGTTTLKTATMGTTGNAFVTFAIPEASGGNHNVEAVGGTSALRATATFAVVPSVALSQTIGAVGIRITVTLRGYAAGESVSINWYDGSSVTALVPATTTSSLGSASTTFAVPEAVKGNHQVDGAGASGSSASTTFTVTSGLSISPTSGTVGSTLNLNLTGFAAGETVTVQWFETSTASTPIATLTSTDKGSVGAAVTVPETGAGLHKVQVTGAVSGATLSQYFIVRSATSLTPASGPAGTTITANLTGYRAGETISVAWYTTTFKSTPIASGVANSVGSATVTFASPSDAKLGDHKVEATGQSSSQRSSTTFAVIEAADNGTPLTENAPPTFDSTVADDFNGDSPGAVPPGWWIAPGSSGAIAVSTQGNRVAFTTQAGNDGGSWLIRDGATFSQAEVQVSLRVTRADGSAGVVLAWNGPENYIAVLANSGADRLELIEVVGGIARTVYRTEDGSISFGRGRDYWLRAESGARSGQAWINLYWSADGNEFEPVGVVTGLVSLTGGVGLMAGGSSMADVTFDDFVARRSHSTGPLQLDMGADGEPTESATDVWDPTPAPTEESPTPEPTPTDEPAATEEPIATPEPTEPAPATPEPTPTLEPTPEPPAETGATPSDAGVEP